MQGILGGGSNREAKGREEAENDPHPRGKRMGLVFGAEFCA